MTRLEVEVFLEVVRTGNISAAAQSLYITQPAVSRHLTSLEQEVGCPLLKRSRGQRQVELTDAGREFVVAAQRLLAAFQEAAQVARDDRNRLWRVSAVGSVGAYLLPGVFRAFLTRESRCNLVFHHYHSNEAYDYIARGEIDFAIIAEDKYHPQVETIPLFREPMILVVGKGSKLEGTIHPTQLDPGKELRLPWNPEYDLWHSFWFSSGVRPRAVLDQMALLEELFTWQGSWEDSWAIVPVIVARALAEKTGVRLLELQEGPPDEIIYYLQGPQRKPGLVQSFLNCVHQELKKYPGVESYLKERAEYEMWFDKAVIYQIYPLGLCGAPADNDGVREHRLLRLLDWVEHIKKTGADTVLLNPLFDSDRHGYDTRDYFHVDPRLGSDEDLAAVCRAFHDAGLRVMLDGVFNHVGRGFWAFRDVQEKKWNSEYKDWFHINFDGNTDRNDGFWYEAWEGHNELVKLNLWNPAVVQHQFDAIRSWVERFDIDGLRLDVAYCLTPEYLKQLRGFTSGLKPDFVLMGETLHGDYNRWMGAEMCHSVTNYECYKGLWSSFNSMNLFEIGHSLARQFGPEPWTMYKGTHLLSFLDNHDVTRIATQLTEKNHIYAAYALMFGMPGVPAVYYGSEWGMEGDKRNSDYALRPALEKPEWNQLTEWISRLAQAKKNSDALCYGSYRNVMLNNKQIIFERKTANERVLVAINADSERYVAHFNAECGMAWDLITGEKHDFGGGSELAPYSAYFWKCER